MCLGLILREPLGIHECPFIRREPIWLLECLFIAHTQTHSTRTLSSHGAPRTPWAPVHSMHASSFYERPFIPCEPLGLLECQFITHVPTHFMRALSSIRSLWNPCTPIYSSSVIDSALSLYYTMVFHEGGITQGYFMRATHEWSAQKVVRLRNAQKVLRTKVITSAWFWSPMVPLKYHARAHWRDTTNDSVKPRHYVMTQLHNNMNKIANIRF